MHATLDLFGKISSLLTSTGDRRPDESSLTDDGDGQHAFSQCFRTRRDNKLTNLTAWIASFVCVPCR